MKDFTNIFEAATTGVPELYFRISVDGGNPIFRERVYCYELYHQMRSRWPSPSEHILTGELDKRAHPILREMEADGAKPDFLVHTPGDMEGNYAIVEVKHATVAGDIQKDLRTLDLFLRKVRYQRAIYLLYGHEANERGVAKINQVAEGFEELMPIELWLHSDAGQPAALKTTLHRTGNDWVRVGLHLHSDYGGVL